MSAHQQDAGGVGGLVERLREGARDLHPYSLGEIDSPSLNVALPAYLNQAADLIERFQPAVAWACKTCNSPRAVDPCQKCGTALTKPADGWEWPGLPDIARIRALARAATASPSPT